MQKDTIALFQYVKCPNLEKSPMVTQFSAEIMVVKCHINKRTIIHVVTIDKNMALNLCDARFAIVPNCYEKFMLKFILIITRIIVPR